MALARKKATTIALEPGMSALLTRAAEALEISRSEFIRQQLALVLEQYRRHPRPKAGGTIRHRLPERGDEGELYANRRRCVNGNENPAHSDSLGRSQGDGIAPAVEPDRASLRYRGAPGLPGGERAGPSRLP